jgi:hypothetical protein
MRKVRAWAGSIAPSPKNKNNSRIIRNPSAPGLNTPFVLLYSRFTFSTALYLSASDALVVVDII